MEKIDPPFYMHLLFPHEIAALIHVATAKPRYINYKHFITLKKMGPTSVLDKLNCQKKSLLAIMQILLDESVL